MTSKNIDMCSDRLFKNIFWFSLPLLASGLLQLLYNAADVIVVGRYASQEALAGVGTSGALINLTVNLFIGLSGGVAVTMAHAVGAKNDKAIHRVVHTAIAISFIAGLFLTVFGAVFAKNMLLLMSVPEDVLPQAKLYTEILFLGMIPNMIYNFGSGLLRSKGDTKRPLYIITVSGIINVVLNLVFVICFKMQADGVGWATIISQTFSAVMILIILRRQPDSSRLSFRKLRIYKKELVNILKIGIPAGIQGMVFSFSNVIIQSSINSFSSAAIIAGSAAAGNIEGFMYVALNTFFQASMTFISQNIGAKQYERIGKIIKTCFAYVAMVGVLISMVAIFAGKPLLNIYCPGDDEAIAVGYERLQIIGTTYMLCGLMEVMSGALRGMGASFSSMLASVIGVCGIRIVWIFTIFKLSPTLTTLFISYPLSWAGTLLVHSLLYRIVKRKYTSHTELHASVNN